MCPFHQTRRARPKKVLARRVWLPLTLPARHDERAFRVSSFLPPTTHKNFRCIFVRLCVVGDPLLPLTLYTENVPVWGHFWFPFSRSFSFWLGSFRFR